MEPILRERFGSGDAFQARLEEAGAFLAAAYRDQLAGSRLPVALESTGVMDRALLDALAREHRLARVRVRTARALCIERVVSRSGDENIARSTDHGRVGRFHDLWLERIAPSYSFDLEVDGADAAAAADAILAFLG